MLLDEVPATCEPLGRRNKLVLAPGLLVGHSVSSCDRISFGGKSPLTGGIKEANAGGTTGLKMSQLGMKALILEDQPVDRDRAGNGCWVLHLSLSGARFERADELARVGVYDAATRLVARYGKNVALALVGPAGEGGLAAAGILNLDMDHVPSRIAARGGLGAVMASKGLKAIVFDAEGGERPPIAHPEAFRSAQRIFTKHLLENPQTTVYRDFSTAAMTGMCNSFGALPTRNFSAGRFEQVAGLTGEHMRETMLARGGESDPSHSCMPGCTIRCSNIYGDADGKAIVSALEYETISLMGSNLGIAELDVVARMNYVANDLGLDTIDLGAALGVAAEAGLMQFGDGARALALLEEIRQGTPLGRTLGHGAAIAGRVLSVTRVPAVKGQAMSGYDPRAIKGTGVTYATSPQGADHTAGNTIRAKVDHLDPTGQAAASRVAQVNMAGYDTLGACIFTRSGFGLAPETVAGLLNGRYDWHVEDDILQALGRETLSLEREFNRRAGFTSVDDRLPEWMTAEPLPPHNSVFDVPGQQLDGVLDW